MSRGLTLRAIKHLRGFDLDIGWTVGRGFTSLFGYSGAGKSLTLAILMGTMRPDDGLITFDGETLYDGATGEFVPPHDRGFGYVTQTGDLFPHLSVRRNVEYGLGGMGREERHDRVSELLDAFHVEDLAEKRPSEISGGQRQRVALARALAPRPRLLLLDEPLTALDMPTRFELQQLLRTVHEDYSIPVVMVTHDLYEACTLSDTLVVYSGTGAIQVGSPAELIADPATPEIRRLLHSMRLPDGLARGTRRSLRVITGGRDEQPVPVRSYN